MASKTTTTKAKKTRRSPSPNAPNNLDTQNPNLFGLSEDYVDKAWEKGDFKFFGLPDESGISPLFMAHGLPNDASIIEDALSTTDIPENATLHEYYTAYETFDHYASAMRIFTQCGGELEWLKGQILNILRPIDKSKTGIAKNGEWGQFLKSLGISQDTSELLRHIQDRFSRIESRQLGYTQMVNQYRDDRRLENDAQGKGKSNGNAKSGKGKSGNTPRSLRLDDLKPKVDKITGSLEFLRDEIPTIGDLAKDADKSKSVLVDLRARLDSIRVIVNDVETSIDTAYDIAQAFIDEGHEISRNGGTK